MNTCLLEKVDKHYPRLRGLVANYRRRHETMVWLGIIECILAGQASRWFDRDEVLWMAAIKARADQEKRQTEERMAQARQNLRERYRMRERGIRIGDYLSQSRASIRHEPLKLPDSRAAWGLADDDARRWLDI